MTFHNRVLRKAAELTWNRLARLPPTKARNESLRRLFDQLVAHDQSCPDEKRCTCGALQFKSRYRRP